ncbi:mechanosensitive ion channel family protein [Mesonia sp. K7]|nr:mechanosensitive ion channel family protein [Mesonia sp. K7]
MEVVTTPIEKIYTKLDGWLEALIVNLPNIVMAIIVFVIFLIFSNFFSKFLNRLLQRRNLQVSVRSIIVKLSTVIIISIGFFVALSALGLNSLLTTLLTGAGLLAMAVGLALQGPLSNTFSGVILSFLPEIRIGDWIETHGFAGEVTEINLRSIVLKENDNNLVMIPNSKIADDTFKNFTRTSRSRIILSCGIGYESDLEFVEKVTKEAIAPLFEQREDEEIEFAYTEFGDSSINFVVRFWTNVGRQKDILMAKHQAILAVKKAFNKNDINIPFPIRTLDFGKNKFRSDVITIENKMQANKSSESEN